MNVLYQSDNNYAPYMGVSVCSLFENNKEADKINVFIIDDGIDDYNKEKLRQLGAAYSRDISFLTGEVLLEDAELVKTFEYTKFRKNTHSYFKMFIDRLLPGFNERIIYIDCDTVVEGDITELMTVDMGGRAIGMVQDSLITSAKTSVGLKDDERYYNSGVILIDMEGWRKAECSDRIFRHIRDVRTYGTVDQDVLNVELRDEIMTLPVRYNLQPVHMDYSYKQYISVYRHKEPYYTGSEIKEALDDPGILHFLRYIGESPWHESNVHPDTPYFDKYLALSPWKDMVKKPSGRGGVFKIEKMMYKILPKAVFLRIFYILHDRMIRKSNKNS